MGALPAATGPSLARNRAVLRLCHHPCRQEPPPHVLRAVIVRFLSQPVLSMIDLPDPRVIDSRPAPIQLAALSEQSAADDSALALLSTQVRALLEAQDEAGVRQLLQWRGPAWLNAAVRRSVQAALDPAPEEALRLQLFALPVVCIAASRGSTVLPLHLDHPDTLLDIFRAAGSLGPSPQLSFSAGLCDEAALLQLPLIRLYRRARLLDMDTAPLDVPAAPLALQDGQQVALRFLVGSNLVPRGAPAFTETAGDVGRWGAALTRELASQLSAPGVTLLPLARPPRAWLSACTLGRFCREEIACQLALGDHLRDLRARFGDAQATVRMSGDGHLNVELRSVWSEEVRTHAWRLDAESDLGDVRASVDTFLKECGVTQIEYAAGIAPGAPH